MGPHFKLFQCALSLPPPRAVFFPFIGMLVTPEKDFELTVEEFILTVNSLCTMNEEELARHVFRCVSATATPAPAYLPIPLAPREVSRTLTPHTHVLRWLLCATFAFAAAWQIASTTLSSATLTFERWRRGACMPLLPTCPNLAGHCHTATLPLLGPTQETVCALCLHSMSTYHCVALAPQLSQLSTNEH